MTDMGPDGGVFTVLFVCTGNICRSALAERLGRAYLDEVLGPDAGRVRLDSAGTGAVVGSAMHPDSALVLGGFGADGGDFTARQLRADLVDDADLILTMTRTHRQAVLESAPRALSRTFTVREAADLLALIGDGGSSGHDWPGSAKALVKQLAAARPRRQSSDADDVPDPIARPLEAHQEAGDLIADALLPLLSHIASLVEASPAKSH